MYIIRWVKYKFSKLAKLRCTMYSVILKDPLRPFDEKLMLPKIFIKVRNLVLKLEKTYRFFNFVVSSELFTRIF